MRLFSHLALRHSEEPSITWIHKELDHAPPHRLSLSNLIHLLPAHFFPPFLPLPPAMLITDENALMEIRPGLPCCPPWDCLMAPSLGQQGASILKPPVCTGEAGFSGSSARFPQLVSPVCAELDFRGQSVHVDGRSAVLSLPHL